MGQWWPIKFLHHGWSGYATRELPSYLHLATPKGKLMSARSEQRKMYSKFVGKGKHQFAPEKIFPFDIEQSKKCRDMQERNEMCLINFCVDSKLGM